jgi:hypothetical protein
VNEREKDTILATWEAEIRTILVGGQPGQIVHETPISKISRAKWTGGVTQAVEHLLCKHEAQSLNPNPPKPPKQTNKKAYNFLVVLQK